MKDKKFRLLKDLDGKQYSFNFEAFCDCIESKVTEEKKVKENKYYTQAKLFVDLGEAISATPEAIKNWKLGKNGPGDMDLIKGCAEFFGVDYLSLLEPQEENEVGKMKTNEIKFVEEIYKEMVDIVYQMKEDNEYKWYIKEEAGHKSYPYKGYGTEEYQEKEECWRRVNTVAYTLRANKLHRLIDQQSLTVSALVRNRLHRIVHEFGGFISDPNGWPLDRWDRIRRLMNEQGKSELYPDAYFYADYTTVGQLYELEDFLGEGYLLDELALKERWDVLPYGVDTKELA
ncbi:MAG: hypothetical protein HUJ56_05795, partial [Erysipelotrichaceae bacterium]|nr:hypothetical protein [Erysipelotrichaceae bacterium]